MRTRVPSWVRKIPWRSACLQYSCGWGAWQDTVHRVSKSWTQLKPTYHKVCNDEILIGENWVIIPEDFQHMFLKWLIQLPTHRVNLDQQNDKVASMSLDPEDLLDLLERTLLASGASFPCLVKTEVLLFFFFCISSFISWLSSCTRLLAFYKLVNTDKLFLPQNYNHMFLNSINTWLS